MLAGLSLTIMALAPAFSGDIPLEIPYKIVDEVKIGPGERAQTHLDLVNLSRTCHALARYCRPLIFHTISLHCSPIVEKLTEPEMRIPVGDVKALNKVLKRAPFIFSLIKSLSLDLVVPSPTPPIGSESDMHSIHWYKFFTFPQCQGIAFTLTRLDLRVILERLPEDLLNAALQFLRHAANLEILVITSRYQSLPVVFEYMPPRLKELTLHQMEAGGPIHQERSKAASQRATVPSLRAFTVTGLPFHGLRSQVLRLGRNEHPWVDFTALQHLQLANVHVGSEPTLAFHTFIRDLAHSHQVAQKATCAVAQTLCV
ncbi:hypothetical protein BKA70DRAFT_1262326 [Coprinopsis sp. MPI-PUGE-AT-0042]|nr:hypothetical protein BKA70DRAFT_1262326 [Coprinopsis sp. MPI-PUGE-AT-0042]